MTRDDWIARLRFIERAARAAGDVQGSLIVRLLGASFAASDAPAPPPHAVALVEFFRPTPTDRAAAEPRSLPAQP